MRDSIVYFVREGEVGNIKIGWTTRTAWRRSRDFTTGNSSPLIPLVWIPGGRGTESQMHRLFADLRIHGEWFRPGPELLSFIVDLQHGVARAKAILAERRRPPSYVQPTKEEQEAASAAVTKMLDVLKDYDPTAPVPPRRRR